MDYLRPVNVTNGAKLGLPQLGWKKINETHFILFQLVLYVVLYLRSALPHRIDVVPPASELPVPVFKFQIAKLLNGKAVTLALKGRYVLVRNFNRMSIAS